MKIKIGKFLFTAVILGVLAGCSSGTLRIGDSEKKVTWKHAGVLPVQKEMINQEKNFGVSGILYGSVDKYIIAGGGINFPYKTVLQGGTQKAYSDIYVFEQEKGKIQNIEHINIDNEIAYGASVTTDKGIYHIGGNVNSKSTADILFFTVDEKSQLKCEKIGELPFTFEKGVAAEKDGKLYILAGIQNGKSTNKMYEYDLASKNIKELSSIPEEKTRIQPVAQILDGHLYLFSGGDVTAYTDGYKYDFEKDSWTKLSSVKLNEKEITLLGAASVKLNNEEMLVIGGVNKEIYDNAVKKKGTLRGQELVKFEASYLNAEPEEFKYNKEILVYNAEKDSWKSLGQLPFPAPYGEGIVLLGNKIYLIGGEIKPGVKTPNIYLGEIKN